MRARPVSRRAGSGRRLALGNHRGRAPDAALWLAKNWDFASVKRTSKGFLTRYHVQVVRKGKLTLRQAPALADMNIAADPAELYEWLGVIGGHRVLPPAAEDDE